MDRNDLISRETLLEAIRKRLGISSLNFLTEQEKVVVEEIFNAPTVEVSGLPKIHYDRGFIAGYEKGKTERPQGDIRWTDKLSVKSNGDIIDFEGRIVGHINLEEMKGGAEG